VNDILGEEEEMSSETAVLRSKSAKIIDRSLDDDSRWQAVISRDHVRDGQFVFAVSSTGVYCRPSCPARRPRRENVAFFARPEQAEKAGFRACLRCRPRSVGGNPQSALAKEI
jgi:AraC family transcriptional regulator of adaptative response/methylated-DNA-[protein]-cysteine methyltransferase